MERELCRASVGSTSKKSRALRDQFRPVRRGARLGHAGEKKEGAARWGQSISQIGREEGARAWAGTAGPGSRGGPTRRRGSALAAGLRELGRREDGGSGPRGRRS